MRVRAYTRVRARKKQAIFHITVQPKKTQVHSRQNALAFQAKHKYVLGKT